MKMVGALPAAFREAAGHTQRSLGEQSVVSEQQIASIEQGRRPLKPDLADQLDDLLDTKGALTAALAHMPEVDLVPLWAEEYLDREREAIVISWYEGFAVPGLLQTEAYARAVFHSRVPVYDDDETEQLVTARVERQEILHRRLPPTTSFVIWEAALRDQLGGTAVQVEQLQKLRETPMSQQSPCRSCRSAALHMPGSTVRSFSWRPPSTSGWLTWRLSVAAN
ncbi:transcriptional regulator with XRE-family HTH domain [Streptomyces sp. TE5632]